MACPGVRAPTCPGSASAEPASGEGVFFGFDYYGRWAAEMGNQFGGPGYFGLRLGGYQKELLRASPLRLPRLLREFSPVTSTEWGTSSKPGNTATCGTTPTIIISPKSVTRWNCAGVPGGKPIYGGGTQENWDYRLAEIFRGVDVIRYMGGGYPVAGCRLARPDW